MPRYTFTGPFETILEGLSHGVNAVLHRKDDDDGDAEHGQPDESTVVARPGDQVVTDEVYPHPHMVNVETEQPDIATVGEQGPVMVTVQPDGTVRTAEELAAALKSVNDAGQKAADSVQVLKAAAAGADQPDVPPTAPIGSENPPPPGNPPAEPPAGDADGTTEHTDSQE